MIVWRICRAAYKKLDGEGARVNGGRWNSEGVAVIYTSTSVSLAALELLVHVEPLSIPADLIAMEIQIPDSPGMSAFAEVKRLPADWRAYPAPEWQADLGDTWVADGTFLLLGVPSAVVPEEYNVLINPAHPAMGDVRVLSVRPFRFDDRLL